MCYRVFYVFAPLVFFIIFISKFALSQSLLSFNRKNVKLDNRVEQEKNNRRFVHIE